MSRISARFPEVEVRPQGRSTYKKFFPFASLKCPCAPVFRSQEARDFACTLDLDPAVVSWRPYVDALCDPTGAASPRNVDFWVEKSDGLWLIELVDFAVGVDAWLFEAAARLGCGYLAVHCSDFCLGHERTNIRDLFRYCRYHPALGDRIRLMAALEECGTMSLAESLQIVREGGPMATVASLILQGFLEADLESAPLGPETLIRKAAKKRG